MLIVTLCGLLGLSLVLAIGLFLETKRLRQQLSEQYVEDSALLEDFLSKWEAAVVKNSALVVENFELASHLADSNKNLAFVLGLQDDLDEDEKKELLLELYRTEEPCLKEQPSSPEVPFSAPFSASQQDLSGDSLAG